MRKMRLKIWLLAVVMLLGAGSVWGQISMTTTGSHTQNFNTLATSGTSNTWIDNSTISNWYSQRTGSGTTYSADAGAGNAGTLYSYGTGTTTERALGTIGSSNAAAGHFAHGVLLQNTSGVTINDIKVTYTLEQWRKGGATVAQSITFYYKISSSSISTLNPNSNSGWTQVSGLTLDSPINTSSGAALDGNASENKVTASNISIPSLSLANNEYIMLKWEDPDHSGTDHGLAIDDVTINWTVASASSPTITSPSPTSLSGFSTITGTASSSQTFSIGGTNLTADLVVTAPSNYEVRENATGTFGSSVSFTPSSGTVASKTIEVRIAASAGIGSPSGNVVCSSTGATSQNISVSGSVTSPPDPEPTNHATNFVTTAISASQITVTWTDATGAQLPVGYLIKASTGTPTEPVDGTDETPGTLIIKVDHGTQTAVFTGLSSETEYNFSIWPYTNSGSNINYKTDGSVPTASATTSVAPSIVNFDTDLNWTAGSAVVGSYASDHIYSEGSWSFTGGPALRNGTATQDGFAGALGTYSWRLRDATVTWTATYTSKLFANQKITSFGFDARRWDGTPSPAYTVEYSFNGGSSWTTATSIGTSGLLDNAAFDNSSNWKTFTQSVNPSFGLAANQFVVRLTATTGERIMIDNFTYEIQSGPVFSGTGNWSATERWNKGVLPGESEHVVVNGNATVDSSVQYSNINLTSDAEVTIGNSNTLTVTGSLVFESDNYGTATLVNNGTLSVSGTTTTQQYLATDRNWYMSSPFSNATAPAGNTYFEYREPGDNAEFESPATAYWKSISSGATLAAGKGYVVNPTTAPTTISLSGTLNPSPVDVILTRTAGKDKEGFNLVGNPYPSYLNVSSINSNVDLDKSFWLRARNAGNTAWVFDSYNIEGSEGVSNSSLTVSGNIPPMQAFWVRVSSGKTGATLTLNNSMRGHQDDSNNKFRAPASLNPLVRLVVSNGINSDEAVVYFNENAADGYDSFDSPKMFNNNAEVPEIYTRAGNEQLVINGLSQYFAGLQLPLGFYAGQANTFSLRASQLRNINSDLVVVLKDKQLNTEFDLTSGESYSFSSDATNTEDRFVLMFKSATGTTSVDNANAGSMFVSSTNGKLMLQLNTEISNASVTVYNATGQSIHSQGVAAPTTVLSKSLDAGVYVVKMVNGGRTMVLRTIVY